MRQNILCLTLLFFVLLISGSCDLPEGPDYGKGTLTLLLPETAVQGAGAQGTGAQGAGTQNKAAVTRSVISDEERAALIYKLSFTGPGKSQTIEVAEGGITLLLEAGQWTIEAEAYDPGDLSTLIGSGSAVITVAAGRNSSVRIPMSVNPVYERTLTKIYLHNEEDLRRVAAGDFDISGNVEFYLERDIDLTQPWTPIGSFGGIFKAKFDGRGHTITVRSFTPSIKTVVSGGNVVYQGFFAYTENADIKNLTVKYELGGPVDINIGDASTPYSSIVGGVAGSAPDTTFENVRVMGDFPVRANGNNSLLSVGGIAGQANDATITGCHVFGAIGGDSGTSNLLYIGGIVGYSSNGLVSESSFTGDMSGYTVAGDCYVGGIAGYGLNSAEITACFAEGNIKVEGDGSNFYVGGIVGKIASLSGSITKSYAAGVVESETSDNYSHVGGIAGESGGTIENCYAWAEVSTSSNHERTAGGIAGINRGTISTCYAAGTVQSKGLDGLYPNVGGIGGYNYNLISGCVALVSRLDATGDTQSTARNGYRIANDRSGIFTGNLARNDIAIVNNTNGSDLGANNQDGEGKPLTDFNSQAVYTGWNFTGGTGVWKFLPGYDYPVLAWQDEPPLVP